MGTAGIGLATTHTRLAITHLAIPLAITRPAITTHTRLRITTPPGRTTRRVNTDRDFQGAIPKPLLIAGSALLGPRPRGTGADHNDACFIVKDANGANIAYVYYEQEPGRRSAANLTTKEEARRIAANIAKLPTLKG